MLKLTLAEIKILAENMLKINPKLFGGRGDLLRYLEEGRTVALAILLRIIADWANTLEGLESPGTFTGPVGFEDIKRKGDVFYINVGYPFAAAVQRLLQGQLPFLFDSDEQSKRDKRKRMKRLIEEDNDDDD
jgi:hypothetical protein